MNCDRLYHYTTLASFESIKINQNIDCRLDTQSFEPVRSHLCCTTKKQCDYADNLIADSKIVILELWIPPTITFEQLDHGQRHRREIRSGICYVVSTNDARIEYLIPCEIATDLLNACKIKYIIIDKNTHHDDFEIMQFADIIL